ncbi:MAG TPA: zinc-dependent metalloprotease [Gemmatimonadaceae bacterium]|nr:zinc-dependent metalloprotease [Gemmatimonadaceae bacterium]
MKRKQLAILAILLPAAQACATLSPATGSAAQPAPAGTTSPAPPAAGNGGGGPTQPAAAAAGSGAQRKTIASVTRGHRKIDGLFTVYQDTTSGSLHMLVPKDKVGKEFIYFTHAVDAPVATGRFRGAFGSNNVFTIRRHFNRVEFVTQGTEFWFDSASPLARAANANISPATVVVQEIVAEDNESYLIKADDIFVTEALTQIKPSPPATPGGPPRFTLGSLSRSKTRVLDVRNYPENTDVIVEYVYENPAPVVRGGRDVIDPRNVSLTVQHSLIQMPQNDYEPRFDDYRVGYFTSRVTDMLSTSAAPYRDLVQRWNLRKKDPLAAVSEPVEPIVFWIENTTPHEFREAVTEGVLRWNRAFEAAGFLSAIQVKVQPDDADWDAGDIRYNVIRWTSSPNPPFGGYGPSFVNPRTGQILGADIMLEYVYVTNRVRYDRLYSIAALAGMSEEPVDMEQHDRFCMAGDQLQHSLMIGRQALEASSAPPVAITSLIREGLIRLTLHEVGHTLGLNHNFKSSYSIPRSKVHDREFTGQFGIGSVMEYPAINVASAGSPQGEYYSTGPAPYDVWAVQFGYTPSLQDGAAEQERVRTLLARSTEPELAFGNDADGMNAPGMGVDPRVVANDLTDDPLGYATERFQIVERLIQDLTTRYAAPGQSYHELRSAYLVLSGEQSSAANVVSRYIGGVYVDRAAAGQPGATRPFTPVPRAEQKQAMRTLEQYVFAPGAFSAPGDLYAHLQMQRRGFEFFGTTEDPKIHERTLNMQRNVLNHLLHARVLTRMTDSRQYGNEYPVTEMMSDLTRAIFAADLVGSVNTFRQQLQLEYVSRLAAIITPPASSGFDYPSKSAALANLQSIQRMLRAKSGGNAETVAHTRHVLFAIDKALKAD